MPEFVIFNSLSAMKGQNIFPRHVEEAHSYFETSARAMVQTGMDYTIAELADTGARLRCAVNDVSFAAIQINKGCHSLDTISEVL